MVLPRDRATFGRWVHLVARRVGVAVAAAEAEAAWAAAGRITAIRLAHAVGRERWLPSSGAPEPRLHGELSVPVMRPRGFGLADPCLQKVEPALADPLQVWAWVCARRPIPAADAARVALELADSRFNLALCLLAAPHRAEFEPGDPRRDDPEHLVTLGHPWHPMTKGRVGLSLAEHFRHAPELLASTRVRAVDVRAHLCNVTLGFADRVAPLVGRARHGWVRIPVHEGQLRRLPRLFGDRFGSEIVAAPDVCVAGRSLLSLRTIWAGDLHLKLALDVHTTSARRLVSTMSVANGPQVSELLAQIQRRDPIVARLEIADERDAAGLRSEAFASTAGQLGCIVRDAGHFAPTPRDRAVWVCAGLNAPGAQGRSRIAELCVTDKAPRSADALRMLRHYVDGLVVPCARLLFGYGISLEPHLQNTLVRVRMDGKLSFVVRDLGGIRIHRPRSQAAGLSLRAAPGSFIVTDDADEVRNKLAHTLLHAHMCSVIGWLQTETGLDPNEAWRAVGEGLRAGAHGTDAADSELPPFFAARVPAKALFVMRIANKSSDYDFTEVDNPLANTTPTSAAATQPV